MNHPDFIILLVDQPARSAEFYADLLNLPPVEQSPAFALFVLPSGLKLGLWSRHQCQPAVDAESGACELVFAVADSAAVEARYRDWSERGLPFVQAPVTMDFGHTCVALDPDGNRLRVYAGIGQAMGEPAESAA